MINVGFDIQNRYPNLSTFGSAIDRTMAEAQQVEPASPQVTTAPSIDTVEISSVDAQKAADFKKNLKSKKWEKIYYPESGTITMRRKNVYDGLEYRITPDGTVQETGLRIKPTVILTEDEDAIALFSKKLSEKKHTPIKDKIANIWKKYKMALKMANSTLKGIAYGTGTGVVLLAGSWLFKSLPAALSKEGPKLWATISHPIKHIHTSGKVIAGIGSAIVLGYHIVKGKLDANQQTAVIDHKLHSGHRDK